MFITLGENNAFNIEAFKKIYTFKTELRFMKTERDILCRIDYGTYRRAQEVYKKMFDAYAKGEGVFKFPAEPVKTTLKDFLLKLPKDTCRSLEFENDCVFCKFIAERRYNGTLNGYVSVWRKYNDSTDGHYFKGDSGVGAEGRIIAECQRAINFNLEELDWSVFSET